MINNGLPLLETDPHAKMLRKKIKEYKKESLAVLKTVNNPGPVDQHTLARKALDTLIKKWTLIANECDQRANAKKQTPFEKKEFVLKHSNTLPDFLETELNHTMR